MIRLKKKPHPLFNITTTMHLLLFQTSYQGLWVRNIW